MLTLAARCKRAGIKEGRQEGLQEGLKKVQEEKIKIAQRLLKSGTKIETISEIIDLPIKEILALKKDI